MFNAHHHEIWAMTTTRTCAHTHHHPVCVVQQQHLVTYDVMNLSHLQILESWCKSPCFQSLVYWLALVLDDRGWFHKLVVIGQTPDKNTCVPGHREPRLVGVPLVHINLVSRFS